MTSHSATTLTDCSCGPGWLSFGTTSTNARSAVASRSRNSTVAAVRTLATARPPAERRLTATVPTAQKEGRRRRTGPIVFELPRLDSGESWRRWIDTYRDAPDDVREGFGPSADGASYTVQGRSLVMLFALSPCDRGDVGARLYRRAVQDGSSSAMPLSRPYSPAEREYFV